MEGLDHAVVVRNVHDHGAGVHRAHHPAVDEKLRGVLRPAHAVDDHVHLRQKLCDVVPVGDEGAHLAVVALVELPQMADARRADGDPRAHAPERVDRGAPDRAAAEHHDLHVRRRTESGDEFAAAAVHAHHRIQPQERPGLARRLAVGGAVAVRVLRREADHLLLKQRVQLLRMRRRVNAGEDDLPLTQQVIFARLDLLDLRHEITGAVDLLHRADDLCPGGRIVRVREAGLRASACLHEYRVSVRYEHADLRGRRNHAVFAVFDVL